MLGDEMEWNNTLGHVTLGCLFIHRSSTIFLRQMLTSVSGALFKHSIYKYFIQKI
jgi:hypothetical protein